MNVNRISRMNFKFWRNREDLYIIVKRMLKYCIWYSDIFLVFIIIFWGFVFEDWFFLIYKMIDLVYFYLKKSV